MAICAGSEGLTPEQVKNVTPTLRSGGTIDVILLNKGQLHPVRNQLIKATLSWPKKIEKLEGGRTRVSYGRMTPDDIKPWIPCDTVSQRVKAPQKGLNLYD